MNTHVLVTLLTMASFFLPTVALSQDIELTPRTPEERLNAAAGNWMASLVVGVRYAKSRGQTAGDFGEFMSELAVPGWGEAGTGTLNVIQGLHSNMMGFPGAEFEIVDQSAESVTARTNRPWTPDFGEGGMFWGVSLEEFESLWEIFGNNLAEHLGLEYEQWIEEGWLFLRFTL